MTDGLGKVLAFYAILILFAGFFIGWLVFG